MEKDFLLKLGMALSLMEMETDVCDRILAGTDSWSKDDCKYLKKAHAYLLEAMNLLNKMVDEKEG